MPRRLRREASPAELWARETAAAKRRALEDRLALQIKACQLPIPDREYLFHPTRRWRVDFAWPEFMVLVEIEGLTPQGGRHQRLAGFEADAVKYGEAQRLGFTVVRLTPTQVRTGAGVRLISDVLQRASWNRHP
jgi:hypothetical protein